MWPVTHDLGFRGLHADALFASGLQRGDEPGAALVCVLSRHQAHQVAGRVISRSSWLAGR